MTQPAASDPKVRSLSGQERPCRAGKHNGENRYEVDSMLCPHCGAEMRMLSVIEEAAVIERILTHLGDWDPRPPSQAPLPGVDWPPAGQIPLT